ALRVRAVDGTGGGIQRGVAAMSTPPGVLLVDLGGVAARFTPERRLRALAAATGLSEKAIHARIWDSGLERDAERGRYASDEIVEVVRTALDERIGADALVEAWALAF